MVSKRAGGELLILQSHTGLGQEGRLFKTKWEGSENFQYIMYGGRGEGDSNEG